LEAVKQFTGMDMVIMKSGGVEAVETACNIASQFWHTKNKSEVKSGKPYFVAPHGCFHGRTRFARSLSSSISSRIGFEPLVSNIIHVPYGDTETLRGVLASLRNLVAGFIVEPIQGEAGVIIPPEGYLKRVAELCKEFDVLLILDEIQTGFGRTGSDWVFERECVKPDLLCGGKADGGGIVPVSFIAGQKGVMSVMQPGTEGATWSGTPIQCIALMAAIKELSDNNLSKQSKEKGGYFLALLKDLARKYPDIVTEIRGMGLFVGVDTIYDGTKLSHALLEEGLWAKETGENGGTLRLSPPLIIPKDELARAVSIFERALLRLKQ
ncbi:MAG: aminotransferase class III-fold pyridoxal phosphate-dependent enzyme, partial [bacterium]|nr:aminotransferase class III-fold pyridoxal phosphate-dependent enzyme [bacterium]